ncbi:hypothetical protein BDB01DRAFT_597203 [Pilobolus umbonatus]|nr:hypothetical protein BDB01DRAFT_597203 [Pilobolus umbonatus]
MEDDIDVYFMESSIPDVRSIEKKTRHNIETKKRELRTMVGAQYKDLISAADAIMNMNKNALIIKDNINHMQQTLHIYNQKDRLQLGDGQQKSNDK